MCNKDDSDKYLIVHDDSNKLYLIVHKDKRLSPSPLNPLATLDQLKARVPNPDKIQVKVYYNGHLIGRSLT